MPLEYEPGKQSRYSDLGFILLGIILEKINGQSLDHLARENIFSPLGMNQTSFRPNPSLQSRIAPTENDPRLPLGRLASTRMKSNQKLPFS